MDDESKQLLRQLIDLQKEQVELMRNNLLPLWTRIRFSMMALLLLMTVMAVVLGTIAFVTRSQDYARIPVLPPVTTVPTDDGSFAIDTDIELTN